MTEATVDGDVRRTVFLSYAHADREVAERVSARLRDVGLRVTLVGSGGGAGTVWLDVITQSLHASDYVVILISNASGHFIDEGLSANWVRELNDRAIPVFPVVIDRAAMPSAIRDVLYLDYTADPDRALAKLVELLAPADQIDFTLLTPAAFEKLVADLLVGAGRKPVQDARLNDVGYDFIIPPDDADLFAGPGGGGWIVQVKHHIRTRASAAMISHLVETTASMRERGYRVALITSGQVTSAAREVARLASIELVEGVDLHLLLLQRPDLVHKHFSPQRLS